MYAHMLDFTQHETLVGVANFVMGCYDVIDADEEVIGHLISPRCLE